MAARVVQLLASPGGPKIDARHHRRLALKRRSSCRSISSSTLSTSQARTVFRRSRRPNIIFTALVALGAQPENCLWERGLPTDIEAGSRAKVELCTAG